MASLAERSWTALVLAAGRGPDDPVARAYSVSHKCLVEIAGKPMLARVVEALSEHPAIGDIFISIDDLSVAEGALEHVSSTPSLSVPSSRLTRGPTGPGNMGARVKPEHGKFEQLANTQSSRDDPRPCITIIPSRDSAAASALAGLQAAGSHRPVLLTTGDHPLLNRAMLNEFMTQSAASQADVTVGLARAETILAAYPAAKRTFLRFGRDSVSGCNLYGLMTPRAAKAIEFWQRVDENRKRPWRLIAAFGVGSLLRYLTGTVDLESAFAIGSRRLGIAAKPVILPFAEAAIDVDKPADKELCDAILKGL